MALYLAKMLCLEVRFQSTLVSKLCRVRRCVPDEKYLAIIAFKGSVVAAKEEELVLLNGATERAAQVIENTLAFSRAVGRGLKELPGTEGLVFMVFKQNAVELIA